MFKEGDVIRFTYRGGTSRDIFKEALVLHPNWKNLVHALDIKILTMAEREVIRTIMNPESRGKKFSIPLINDILRRMDPPNLIKNHLSFYHQFVVPFMANKDIYRTYYKNKMTGIQVININDANPTPQAFAGQRPLGQPKPLFGK